MSGVKKQALALSGLDARNVVRILARSQVHLQSTFV
jgi:hypothetical protein